MEVCVIADMLCSMLLIFISSLLCTVYTTIYSLLWSTIKPGEGLDQNQLEGSATTGEEEVCIRLTLRIKSVGLKASLVSRFAPQLHYFHQVILTSLFYLQTYHQINQSPLSNPLDLGDLVKTPSFSWFYCVGTARLCLQAVSIFCQK